MPPIAFLALLTITLLVLAAFRLELNFRRDRKEGSGPEAEGGGPERRTPEAGRRPPVPELRASPAGGYWQAPISPMALRRA